MGSINKFTNLMGLVLNKEKTGSCKISRKESDYQVITIPGRLPAGEVRWGLFLKLDSKSGRFLIDQTVVDKHIAELGTQLDACKSVFDWIQVWNIYAVRFFTTHFGKSANCLGRERLETAIKTFERIQKALFRSTGGSVTTTVNRVIQDGSGTNDIPDGFLYLPTSLCDLDLKNPFTIPYLLLGDLPQDPVAILDKYLAQEKVAYEAAKSSFNKKSPASHFTLPKALRESLKGQPFMPFEEFPRYPEKTSPKLLEAYMTLLLETKPKNIVKVVSDGWLSSREWNELNSYYKSIVQLHSSDMINRFGEMRIAEDGILPTETDTCSVLLDSNSRTEDGRHVSRL